MPYYVSKASQTLPLSLGEIREQLELHADASNDSELRRLLWAATRKCETFVKRDFHLTKRVLQLDRWHDLDGRDSRANRLAFSGRSLKLNSISIPRSPLVAVDSVTYLDNDGTRQTLAASGYTVDTRSTPPRFLPAYNETWPSARYDTGSIEITTWTGYTQTFTAAATDVVTPTDQHFQNGDVVRVDNYGGALPAGLSPLKEYYVVAATSTTFKLSLQKDGAAVDITDTGTGTHVINQPPQVAKQAIAVTVQRWFEDRSSGEMLPEAAKSLLADLRVVVYPGHYAMQR